MTGTFDGAPWLGVEPTGDRIALDAMRAAFNARTKLKHRFSSSR
jgi:hypothetical protein